MSTVLNQSEATSPSAEGPNEDEHLPNLIDAGGIPSPEVPRDLDSCGVPPHVLSDLALKLANTVPHFTTEWLSEKICLPMQLVDEICWQHKDDRLVEILGENGPFSYRYAITGSGRDISLRLMEFCGYVGPAPVSLEMYAAFLDWQIVRRPQITSEAIRASIADLVLTDEAVQVAELAVSACRSLFLFGPAGNGKTSIGKMLHKSIDEDIWIPHCLNIDGNIIRILDPQTHTEVGVQTDEPGKIDRRWMYIERPFVIAGGEMTLDETDLSYNPAQKFYDAPLHVKANGGTFLLDDFGRQRMNPEDLLNRWIVPLETQYDYLTLHSGQKLQIPFRQMLIVSTNLTVSWVPDPEARAYRVILEQGETDGLTAVLPARSSSFQVPDGILAPGTESHVEVGAIGPNGNCTLVEVSFTTR